MSLLFTFPIIATAAAAAAAAPMSPFLDAIDQKCNELKEQAVSATWLSFHLRRDLSVKVELADNNNLFRSEFTFPVARRNRAPQTHRRVFSTLAGIVGTNGLPNVTMLDIKLPEAHNGLNYTRTSEMAPFLQSIADSSTIQYVELSTGGSLYEDADVGETVIPRSSSSSSSSTEPIDTVRLVTAIAANLASPQSVLQHVVLDLIIFDNRLFTTLCNAISSRECPLVILKFDHCQVQRLRPLWSALAVNRSVSNLIFDSLRFQRETLGGIYGTQQLQSMLETNTTMIGLSFLEGDPRFPNSFFTALGAGLASNTTLEFLKLPYLYSSEDGNIRSIFEGGLDRNTGLKAISLNLKDMNSTRDLVSGLDNMAKNIRTKRRRDGSHRVSTLKILCLGFDSDPDNVDCGKPALDCLVRNSASFALEELHFRSPLYKIQVSDASLFDKLAAFIQAYPSLTTFHLGAEMEHNDAHLTVLANTLENNATMTEFQTGRIDEAADLGQQNEWSPTDHPNWTRILCSVARNKRELPMFLESSKRSLLPSVLNALLKPNESKREQIVNLNHALYLIRNLPDLFSAGGGSDDHYDDDGKTV